MKCESGTTSSLSGGSYQREGRKTIIEIRTGLKLLITISLASGTKMTQPQTRHSARLTSEGTHCANRLMGKLLEIPGIRSIRATAVIGREKKGPDSPHSVQSAHLEEHNSA